MTTSSFPASSYLRQGAPFSDGGNDVPEMTSASSLQSFPESDSDSLSSSARSSRRARGPASSPRSIFARYWSSPQHIKSLETEGDNDDGGVAIVTGLKTLELPLTVDDEDPAAADSDRIVPPPIEPKKIFNDDSVDYRAALAPKAHKTTRTPRRQILPTPPPPARAPSPRPSRSRRVRPTADDLPPSSPLLLDVDAAVRRSPRRRSTSALLGRRPRRSCLRGSRSSCSAINKAAAAASSGGGMTKSVSFHSRVSVLEFNVPREEELRGGQEGWLKIFGWV